jgi:predicted nuclease of predicted toxin-antitoxin system
MRFLADENFPGDAVTALRAAGHDVLWIRTDAPGITDQDVLARSLEDVRVLLTFDKDFGELAWRSGLPATCGIVLFRLPALSPTGVGKIIADVLMARDDWAGHFSVACSPSLPLWRAHFERARPTAPRPRIARRRRIKIRENKTI